MSVYNNCLLCGKSLNRAEWYGDGSFTMQCEAEYSDEHGCYFCLYYTKDEEIYEYSFNHPNGFCLNAVIMAHHTDKVVVIITRGGRRLKTFGCLVPYIHDLDYFDRKIKTITVFG